MLRFMPLALILCAVPAHAEERNWMVSGFDRIRVEGAFTVHVTTGPQASPKARTRGDARAIERVQVRVEARTLVVSADINAARPDAARRAQVAPPPIEIGVPILRGLSVTGDAAVDVDRMTGARVDLSVSGPGTLDVAKIDADKVTAMLVGNGAITISGGRVLAGRFQSSGAGTIDAAGLSVADLTVIAQGGGEGSYTARNTADIFASGQGAIDVAGTPACTIRGTAPVTCGTGVR